LAIYAQSRSDYFLSIKSLDSHKGFNDYLSNPDNYSKLGYDHISENSSYGFQMSAVHLIEWIFAADYPHDSNQVNPIWTRVGIGVAGTATDLIFGR
jgi:uncharacterized protein YkwD